MCTLKDLSSLLLESFLFMLRLEEQASYAKLEYVQRSSKLAAG